MNSAKWKTVKDVFSATLDLPENRRASFLAEYDAEIGEEVKNLLSAHFQAEGFIDKPILIEQGIAEDKIKDNFIGRQVENYLILERIGAGGMGAVYLAERVNSDFKQKVALKIIKRGMDSEAILKRFARERKILSTLKHPNIAQLIDGGISSEGLPFFVMEFVDGIPLNQFCRENRLSLEKHLKIFRQICAVVDYAHKNLIIHRDLKPSNVLVTEDGVPKLLDFGIAKLLTSEDAETTATQAKMFTPEYASPEQILGKNVTTGTDVYSLGVILYELLTQHRPFDVKGKSFDEIVKNVCETEPPKPSETIENESLTTENEAQGFQIPKNSLRGDLDNIILKALRKEPAERYGSVQQFSEDILRFLRGLPILARPQTLKYRFGKYVKRHKAGVSAAALVLLSLIGGISVATWQAIVAKRERVKAEQRFNDVRQLANTILFDHYERIKNLPGATEARAKLVSDALVYLDKIAHDSSDNPDLQRELVGAYKRLADIQGGVGEGGNSGESGKSRENYLKALEIQEKLALGDSSTIEDRRALGNLYLDVSHLFTNENEQPIQAEYVEKGLNIFKDLQNVNSNQVQRAADFARALWFQANIVRLKGDNRGAIEIYSQAAEIYENLGSGNENPNRHKRNAALTYKNIGGIYHVEKDYQKALEFYQKAFFYDKENAKSSPNNVESQMDLSFTYKSLAKTFYQLGEREKSLAEYRQAVEIQEEVYKTDIKNIFAAKALFGSYSGFAEVYRDIGNFAEAEDYYKKSQKMIETNFTGQGASFKSAIANHFWSYGNFFVKKAETEKNISEKLSDLKSAREKFTEAINIYQTLQKQNILDPAFSENLPQIIESIEKTNREILRLTGK